MKLGRFEKITIFVPDPLHWQGTKIGKVIKQSQSSIYKLAHMRH
jgi:hypothetical protein